MKNQIQFLILFIVLCFGCLQAQVNQEWVERYSGFANSLAIDNSGNVYVTGSSYASGTDEDYATIKYSSSGEQLWVQRYNGTANSKDCASSILVDGLGNVYVTGWSYVAGGPHFATIKYSSAGEQKWIQIYKEVTPSWNRGILPSLAVDGLGNVYVTGSSVGIGNNLDYATIKYDSSGVQQWVQKYDMNTHDESKSIAVDDSGNVYVTGSSATIKYNSAGVQQWIQNPGIYGRLLAVDSLGNVYITGTGLSGYITIKYNSSGVQQWIQMYGEQYGNAAYSLVVDGSGNVYVTGYSGSFANGLEYATIKYNSSGVQKWVQRYKGPRDLGAIGGEVEIKLAVDGSGNVYVTGTSRVSGDIHDYATIKYNSFGDSLWVVRYNGTGTGWDGAHSIAVDNSENVYVTGWSNGSGGLYYATIKYSQTDGITAPSDLKAQSVDSSFIKVTWQDNSNDEEGFYIERTQINDSSQWEVIDAVIQNVNQYSDYLVTRNLKYYYRVKAYSGNIFSGYSNTDSAILGGNPSVIPVPPSKLTLFKRTPKAISMGWHDNSGNENGFIIFRKSERDLFFKIIDSVNTDVVTYQEVGVSPILNYYYKICSYNSSGISDFSNTLTVLKGKNPLWYIKTPELSGNYILYENYPNPFNPVTNLEFGISKLGFVSLKIYDMLGKEVATLVNASLNPGTYKYSFDASSLPSGVYFYKLTVDGNNIDTKRMILLK